MAEIEHVMKALVVDGTLDGELKKLQDEGWQTIPGVPAVVIHHLIRQKAQPASAAGGMGSLKIDDSKVMILRDGKLVQ